MERRERLVELDYFNAAACLMVMLIHVLSLGVTALASGLTIGGKALGKTFAMECSTKVVYAVGRVIHVFHREK